MRKFGTPFYLLTLLAIFILLVVVEKSRPEKGVYHWQKKKGTLTLISGDSAIGWLEPLRSDGFRIRDHIETVGEGVFRITRTCTNHSGHAVDSARLTLDFVHGDSTVYHMIPAVSYDGNLWGRGLEPKGYRKGDSWWTFSRSRCAIPGATYSEGSQWAVALWGPGDSLSVPFSCSLMPDGRRTTHRLIWPEEEMPLTYSNRDTYQPGYRTRMTVGKGESVTLVAMLAVTPVRPQHAAIRFFLEKAWEMRPQPKIPVREPKEIWNLAVRFVNENLWAEEGTYKGFSIGLWLRNGGWIQRPGWKYEIGWAGQNLSVANSLLTDYLWFQNRQSLDRAITCLDTWAQYCPLPNGLIRNHFDYVLGLEKGEEVLDACNLGDAAADFLTAYDLAGKCGIRRERYREIALRLCDFLRNDQQPSGQYGKGWDKNGKCLYRDGTIGAFIIPAMIRAYQATSEEGYLSSARKAYDFYFDEFARLGYTSAGAIDTWCIDKESSWPMLRSAMMLYGVTREKAYLDKAEQTSWYLSTWLWHWSVPYADTTDFRRYGYDTFGGTAVSTQHHHLDPFGLALVPEWLKLAELTGHVQWREKALAAWANANQVVADGKQQVHGVVRPAGAQTEAYFQARWSGKPGYFADWLVIWPSAFRMETLRTVGLDGI